MLKLFYYHRINKFKKIKNMLTKTIKSQYLKRNKQINFK